MRANWFVSEFEQPVVGNYSTAEMPMQFSATPVGFSDGSPQFAEHTTDVLTEIGLDAAAIDQLIASDTVVAR